jgi:hypothetical protein
MKPGIKTSEFWTTLISQALAFLVMAGVLSAHDQATLGTAITNAVTAVFTLITSAGVVSKYIQARLHLKTQWNQRQPEPGPTTSPAPVAPQVIRK